jgi:hypothetical protein
VESTDGHGAKRRTDIPASCGNAAAPADRLILQCRIAPKTATVTEGEAQAYSLIGICGDPNEDDSDQTEFDLTTVEGTTFTFTTNMGNRGCLGGANNHVYVSDRSGGYSVSITATYNDALGGTCEDTATLTVLRGPTSNNNGRVAQDSGWLKMVGLFKDFRSKLRGN